ncbi:phosphatase PAP2 family protein [Herminiimonas arsenitoxidans]|uniref:phosphatase PAP2 family protein n=1 Tax=Herminiimonas arsenitoxidans TaxID=1809410 RepID=UPI0009FB6553|nr:phosphatase PAP2 family protein [Herminiimonas arsenitoxidans]
MHIIRKFYGLLLVVFLTACATQAPLPVSTSTANAQVIAAPVQQVYLSPEQIDTTRFLGPPPDEAATKREIAYMLSLQKQRTREQAKAAAADLDQSVFRFADVMGDKFEKEFLPKTAKLFANLYKTGNGLDKQGKKKWKRVRPPLADARIHPVTKYSSSGSYPSGHATFSYLSGIVLADMVPEKSEQIFARARAFGENRVIGGVHYPSDVAAGQRLATMIAVLIQQNPAFQNDYAAARAELRAELGLP